MSVSIVQGRVVDAVARIAMSSVMVLFLAACSTTAQDVGMNKEEEVGLVWLDAGNVIRVEPDPDPLYVRKGGRAKWVSTYEFRIDAKNPVDDLNAKCNKKGGIWKCTSKVIDKQTGTKIPYSVTVTHNGVTLPPLDPDIEVIE